MPGWLWIVVAVVLGVVIYLLLRGRGRGGRHRAPAIEYDPPESFEGVDDEFGYESGEPGAGGELRSAATELKGAAGELRGAADTLRTHDGQPDADDRLPAEAHATHEQQEQEELEEDAELRHDEGYVETIGEQGRADGAATAKAQVMAEENVAPPDVEEPVAEEPVADSGAESRWRGARCARSRLRRSREKAPEAPATGVDPSEYGAGSALPGPGGTGPQRVGGQGQRRLDALLHGRGPRLRPLGGGRLVRERGRRVGRRVHPMGRPSPLTTPRSRGGPASGPSSSTSAPTRST